MWKKIKSLFTKAKDEGTYDLIIWAIVDGPIEEEPDSWTLWVKASVDSHMFVTELYFSSFNSAYAFTQQLGKENFIKLEMPSDLEVKECEWERQQ